MKTRVLLGLSVLAGAGVMVYVTVKAGADLAGVLRLLPVKLHLLALATFLADYLGRAARISLLATGIGHPVRFSTSLAAVLAGEAAGAVTPSKAGSAPARIAVLTRDRMDVGTGGAVVAGESIAEAAVLLPLGLLAVLWLPHGRTGAYASLGFAVVSVGAVFALYWVARLPLRDAPRWWLRLGLGDRRWRVLRVVARRFRHRAVALEHLSVGRMVAIGAATLVHIAGRLLTLPALAFGRVHGNPVGALVGWSFVLLYAGAVAPVPAGGGAVEAIFAAALGGVLPSGTLAGMLIWWRFYTFYLPALLGGAVLLLGGVLVRRPSSGGGALGA